MKPKAQIQKICGLYQREIIAKLNDGIRYPVQRQFDSYGRQVNSTDRVGTVIPKKISQCVRGIIVTLTMEQFGHL